MIDCRALKHVDESVLRKSGEGVRFRADTEQIGSLRLLFVGCWRMRVSCKLSFPVCVVGTVSKQHWPGFQADQQPSGKSNVVGLTGAQCQHRQTIALDGRMNLARQAAARSSQQLALALCDAGSMLMHADNEVSIIWKWHHERRQVRL